MNIRYTTIFLAAILLSCKPGTDNYTEQGALEELSIQRDSLMQQYAAIGDQLKEIESNIYQLQKEQGVTRKFPVTTSQLDKEPFEHYVEVQGTVEADQSIVLNAEAQGAIQTILVEEGKTAFKGQRIAAFDTEILDKNIKELEDSYELAAFVFEKQENLWNQGIGSELSYRQAKNNKLSLENKLATLKAQKRKSEIIAPFYGTVDEIFPKIGESVGFGTPVCRLVNIDQVKITADISEKYVSKVNRNSKAILVFPATGEQKEVMLHQVGNYINPNNRTFRVSAKLNNPRKNLLPNMVAKVLVRDYYNPDAVVIPTKTIMQDINGNDYVYVVEQENDLPTVKKILVETGTSYGGHTEIILGLSGIEELVIDGARSVKPGDIVSIIK